MVELLIIVAVSLMGVMGLLSLGILGLDGFLRLLAWPEACQEERQRRHHQKTLARTMEASNLEQSRQGTAAYYQKRHAVLQLEPEGLSWG